MSKLISQRALSDEIDTLVKEKPFICAKVKMGDYAFKILGAIDRKIGGRNFWYYVKPYRIYERKNIIGVKFKNDLAVDLKNDDIDFMNEQEFFKKHFPDLLKENG